VWNDHVNENAKMDRHFYPRPCCRLYRGLWCDGVDMVGPVCGEVLMNTRNRIKLALTYIAVVLFWDLFFFVHWWLKVGGAE